ncbi:GTP-binding protein [Promethearchaeum syntrophicum]|uniref:GTP-binding protein n=1 Tax=Promethearchaeum syntrophicum TaxID=2594042 RepID=A0A5B9D7A7_9ARCH|nr:GTP-binding protein [Candidatus Prometheoarchaeum syntrophicum]
MSNNKNLIPIHVGLLGHIDAGKTAIAKCLTEIASTAGLDKHSQAQKRGITIDMGFTFFSLENYMITLVDAPGHADLIRSVVSCANIIDIGFLVIDALQGFQVQTGEHFLILDLLNLSQLFILINKTDLVDKKRILEVRRDIGKIILGTRFEKSCQIFEVSAIKNIGFSKLKEKLLETIKTLKIQRQNHGTFKFLIDHHFKKKGQGTILTGTVVSGKAKIGENLSILPEKLTGKIRSIQKWKKEHDFIEAGDRCGISLSNISPEQISRGSFATDNESEFTQSQIYDIAVKILPLYNHSIKFGQHININHGMMALNGRIYPYRKELWKNNEIYVPLSPNSNLKVFNAILYNDKVEYVKKGEFLLLSRLDLSPKSLRIMGSSIIVRILKDPIYMFKEKIKKGKVKDAQYRVSSVIVENLASSIEGAHSIINLIAEKPFGKIKSTFGKKGNVEVLIRENFKEKMPITKETTVSLKVFKKFQVDNTKSYSN